MHKYVELFKEWDGKIINYVGSDGVIFCDGRWSLRTIIERAESIARKRGACGYRVITGESLFKTAPLTGIIPVV